MCVTSIRLVISRKLTFFFSYVVSRFSKQIQPSASYSIMRTCTCMSTLCARHRYFASMYLKKTNPSLNQLAPSDLPASWNVNSQYGTHGGVLCPVVLYLLLHSASFQACTESLATLRVDSAGQDPATLADGARAGRRRAVLGYRISRYSSRFRFSGSACIEIAPVATWSRRRAPSAEPGATASSSSSLSSSGGKSCGMGGDWRPASPIRPLFSSPGGFTPRCSAAVPGVHW
jgi:hypothetical protein